MCMYECMYASEFCPIGFVAVRVGVFQFFESEIGLGIDGYDDW